MVSLYANDPCILIDIERTGARIALPDPLTLGQGGYLKVGGFELFCEAVRIMSSASGGVNGLRFDEPLPNEAVLAIRHHAETLEHAHRRAMREQVRA